MRKIARVNRCWMLLAAVLVQATQPHSAVTQSVSIFSKITVGASHTCALTAGGGVKCWGDNEYAQLGDGTQANRSIPAYVSGLSTGVTALVAGDAHTCVLMDTAHGNGVKCWGENDSGQLGDGTQINRLIPVDVSGLGGQVTALAAGWNHTCVLLSGGGVKCWGGNASGQLGDGTTLQRYAPVNVSGLQNGVNAVVAHGFHTCALLSGGGVKCWGANGSGELGDGTTQQRLTPVDVNGLGGGATALAAGWAHTCAVIDGGSGAKCWGDNQGGQLGDGTTQQRLTPVNVIGLGEGATALATGDFHTCVLTTSGGAKCWGGNWAGQLGDGTTIWRNTPVEVSGSGSGLMALAAGYRHTCALMTDGGGGKCWGSNVFGQLGDGTTIQSLTPVDVIDNSERIAINFQTGRPGSYFLITGVNFLPGSAITVTINSVVFTTPLLTNETGGFYFFINTTGADAGWYSVTVSVNSSASVAFLLDTYAPERQRELDGYILSIPSEIAVPARQIHLPLISHNP